MRTRLSICSLRSLILFLGLSTMLSVHAADKVVMNLGWAAPLESDYGILATKFKELTEQYTNGEVEVKLHC
jgi:TRAP-type C4-dicarboxylate transport system substrate-binding protein